MATSRFISDETLVAGADLSAYRYYGVTLSAGTAVLATAGAVWGVLQDGDVAGHSVAVRRQGISKCLAGGTITNGDYVTTDSAGKFVKLTPYVGAALGAYSDCIGQAMEDAVVNQVFAVDVHIPVPTVTS